MIESAIWTNLHNGQSIVFNSDSIPFETFDTSPEWRQESDSKPQDHGEYIGLPYLGSRLTHVEGDILQQTSADYMAARRTMVKALLPSARYGNRGVGTLQMLFTGMNEYVTSVCTLDGSPELPIAALGPAHGRYMINWKAADPRLYSLTEYSATTGVPGVTAGVTFPVTFPISFTAPSGVTGDLTVSNSGDIEVYPRFQILGPATAPALTLLSPGTPKTVEFGGLIIASGEVITVDFETRTAVSSSGADVYYTLTKREWWALDSGNTTFRYSAFSASAPSAATILWRNAYML